MNKVSPRAFPAAPALVGSAMIALWNDVEPGREAEYDAWHTGEHVPQRVGIPGILSGRRYVAAEAGGMPRYFTLYDLQGPEVLESAPYRAVVRHPTPWSAAMRPSLSRFLRLPCRRVLSLGGGIGGALATLRFPATPPEALRSRLAALLACEGITAVHLGEPFADGQPFPVGGAAEADRAAEGGSLVLVEGTGPRALRLALFGQDGAPEAGGAQALYSLAFLAAKPLPVSWEGSG